MHTESPAPHPRRPLAAADCARRRRRRRRRVASPSRRVVTTMTTPIPASPSHRAASRPATCPSVPVPDDAESTGPASSSGGSTTQSYLVDGVTPEQLINDYQQLATGAGWAVETAPAQSDTDWSLTLTKGDADPAGTDVAGERRHRVRSDRAVADPHRLRLTPLRRRPPTDRPVPSPPCPEVLEGVRVVDATTGPVGGMATMVLADFGADVVKVERPGGDRFRALAASPLWLRGKRSVTADLARRRTGAAPARPRRRGRRARRVRPAVAGPPLGRRRRRRDRPAPRPRALLDHRLGPGRPAGRGARLRRRGGRPRRADAGVRAPAAPRRSGLRRRAGRQPRRRPRRRAGDRRRPVRPGPRWRRPARRDEPAAGPPAVRPRRAAARRDGRAQRPGGAEHPRRRRRPARRSTTTR